ncbi:uncharacterized protein [Spinacia oleracea]|uniref:Uncharacterized protein LOC110786717 isoform X1 n=1 Tax=Spinacia oleracea TaxID=3562 RepID=A0A9R0ICX1_SPIOL|nr:uncharacterized protein LOC110786717 isoform X1 [Spinacia oleracea]XP_021846980.1 uncharacterized protein LOC110786717 isoform X1 [Spinacia oleracea]XP_056696209.1 uncharacterized protein LOC110786717 isoform X1 [Spinacia oleracea]XP_056696210.1 uncharacterized protein LOC110786717 isoform X1 [Spinacia oleracea]XP_056696211.1 uncharacterized protein LOC110786717 isoform X1 [Spinacia oleracea]XP_056696212.1 uncharacterized protein LOC110786717 isoform X1 [Spinacia oleracea]
MWMARPLASCTVEQQISAVVADAAASFPDVVAVAAVIVAAVAIVVVAAALCYYVVINSVMLFCWWRVWRQIRIRKPQGISADKQQKTWDRNRKPILIASFLFPLHWRIQVSEGQLTSNRKLGTWVLVGKWV